MNKTKKVIFILSLVSLCFGAVFYGHVDVLAGTSNLDFAATLEPSVSIAIEYSTNPLAIELTSKGTFNSQDIKITSYSNSDDGYVVTVSAPTTDLITPSGDAIPTLADLPGGYTTELGKDNTFTTNRWGIAIDNGNYFPISATGLKIMDVSGGFTGKAGATSTVHLGAKLDLESPTGTYETALNFAIVAKIPE
ncbi:hypothetical protein IKF02_00720 [Candidatus Saccharibacteria bacterium]|nr:hypothetical protein [Candidatus Saccharibacteria bacterium]